MNDESRDSDLVRLGFDDRVAEDWTRWLESSAQESKPLLRPARVLLQRREAYLIHTGDREFPAEVSGKFRHEALGPEDFPAVGDWVVVSTPSSGDRATILSVLPRQSKFSRQAAGGRTQEQIVATNVDTLFIVCGLDGDFNPRRIERYLTAAWDSGARPIVVLNKADLCEDPEGSRIEAESVALGTPVCWVSAAEGKNLDELTAFLEPGRTVAFVGSSGVGKSTLINRLLGREVQATAAVRADDSRGRHTTTERQLFVLEDGALLLDTPGMRELQLWAGEGDATAAFDDILELAGQCRYRDCGHGTEDGCAIQGAIADGQLAAERLDNFRKLERELRFQETKQDAALRARENQRLKVQFREYKRIQRQNRKR